MELRDIRLRVVQIAVDIVESLTGEELLVVVTRSDAAELTAWSPFADAEVLEDVLNGWTDHSVWNAPKSL
jgi:hypothetical protein